METSSSQPNPLIEYVGFFNRTGYGQSAAANVLSLADSKYRVRINCLHRTPEAAAFDPADYQKLLNMSRIPENDRAVQVLHCVPQMFHRVPLLQRKMAFATFETFDPPADWTVLLNRCDAVICPSEFNREQFLKAGVSKPLFCIPHVLNMDIWKAGKRPEDGDFRFLFVGTWRRRKGWDILLEAWMAEFSHKDGVRLIIKTDKTDQAVQDVEKMKKRLQKKEIAPIIFERSIFNERQMADLYRSVHCSVLPTLGEGFGLPAMQSMAVKTPVIVTNFGGCKEYAKAENCTLLEPSGFMVHESIDPIPQFSYKKWPRIKVVAVQEAMRGVLSNYKTAQEKADKAYGFVRSNFGFRNFAEKFDLVMETVYRGGYPQAQPIKRNFR